MASHPRIDMKVCVLQPDYSQSTLDYKDYAPPRNLSPLLPEDRVDHIFLNKATTYRQLKELKKHGYDIFVNLCNGYLDWDVPSIDVIVALEQLNLPYTGATSSLYTPSREVMKWAAFAAGVDTPAYALAENLGDVKNAYRDLEFPLCVKPLAGDNLGIDHHLGLTTKEELLEKAADAIANYDRVLIEEYVEGCEFTVLITANPNNVRSPVVYKSLERLSSRSESNDLKAKPHSERYTSCSDVQIDQCLRDAAKNIFFEFNGSGYARLDFRVTQEKKILFLEIDFVPTVFTVVESEGLVDTILKFSNASQAEFLKYIISEGIARYQCRQKKYQVRRGTNSDYGIYAVKDLRIGEVVRQFEERAIRIATNSYVQAHWDERERELFQRYAVPISEEVFILWSTDPAEWSPTNHSCNPNMAFRGLDWVAIRDIMVGEELTIDYTTFSDEKMLEFQCQCGAAKCRGIISGIPSNSLTRREQLLRALPN